MIVLAIQELLRSELLVLIHFCLMHELSVRIGENAYPFRCLQEILDASLPLLEGSSFHDMYVATW